MIDFCGIGNACIDIIATVDDSFLKASSIEKGQCTYLDLQTANQLEKKLENPAYIPGGCAANVASCVALLGGSAAFIGRVTNDNIGHKFINDLSQRGINFPYSPLPAGAIGSTRIFCLTTPDTERSFAAYYGVQEDLSEEDLDESIIAQSRFFYLDGYALNSKRGKETFLKAAHVSRENGNTVVFSPNDLSILKKYDSAVKAILPVTDLILLNAVEAMDLTSSLTLNSALNILKSTYKMGAVTDGANGVYVFESGQMHKLDAAPPPGDVIDTNGAGDNFAGGFLCGLARGYDLIQSARLGLRCAAAVITHFGARIEPSDLSFIQNT